MIRDGPEVSSEIDHHLTSFIDRTKHQLGRFDVLNYAPTLWPHLYLLEVMKDERLTVRILGQRVRELIGMSCTGRYLDELMHGSKSGHVTATYEACVREGCAVRMHQRVMIPKRPVVTVKACAVPLFHGDCVTKLAGLMYSHSAPAHDGLRAPQRSFEVEWMPRTPAPLTVTG